MKKLLMTIAVVTLLAVPSMATAAETAEDTVDIDLTIDPYILMDTLPADAEITVADGLAWGDVALNWIVRANFTPVISSVLFSGQSGPGDWTAPHQTVTDYSGIGGAGYWSIDVTAKVQLANDDAGVGTVTMTVTLGGAP